jgi:hypothetical protein
MIPRVEALFEDMRAERKKDAERYRLIHAKFAAMTPAQQQDFLALLGIDYLEVAPLSKVIDAALKEDGLGIADVWHEGSKSFYRARLLQKLTSEKARVTELEAKLADVSEHAAYEQRRADGAVAELVEVHAKLAEAERKHLDAWRESQVERESAVRAERALDEALFRQLL